MQITPAAPELIGDLVANEYFKEHFQEFETEFLDAVCAMGYPRELWPSDTSITRRMVHWAKRTGTLPNSIVTALPMTHNTYTGDKPPACVIDDYNRTFGSMERAFFFVTKGEDWWPHDKAFLVHNAETAVLYFLYERAVKDQSVLVKPKRGRPRNEEAHAARAEKAERYQQWLADCEAYRTRFNELKAAYEKAFREYVEYKAQGAPKWIP